MKKWFVFLGLFLVTAGPVWAQTRVSSSPGPGVAVEATESSEAALAEEASSSAVEKVVEKKPDLTETTGEAVGKLEQILREHPVGPLTWNNPLQHIIRRAVDKGVPATTIVLVLAFPMVAAVIAASRHLIGLRGFGIFTPAILSVAFVASGIGPGLALFVAILLMATLGRVVLKRLRLQYLPRMALLLWFVSMGVLGVIVVAPEVGLGDISAVGIFPMLLLILLAESFIEVQLTKSMRTAVNLTVETLVLALIAGGVLGLNTVQRLVLLNPELTVAGVALFDIFVGKYVGLRLKEYWRFRQLAEK